MKARALTVLTALTATMPLAAQQDSRFQNFGILDNPNPINAGTVENFGNINVETSDFLSIPFRTQNTTNFINHGSATFEDFNQPFDFEFRGTGFIFDYLDGATGLRSLAERFENSGQILSPGRIEIRAKEISIENLGLVGADRRGIVKLEGEDVSLFGGRIRAGNAANRSNFPEGNITVDAPLYENPLNVREDAWGVTVTNRNNQFSIQSLAFSPGVSPFHTVTNAPGLPNTILRESRSVSALNPNFYMNSDFNTITVNSTNFVHRATVNIVFAETNVMDMAELKVGFVATTNSANFIVNANLVEFGVTDRDITTGIPFTRTLTLIDEASEVARPDGNLAAHFVQQNEDRAGRFRPRAHVLSRDDDSLFDFYTQAAPMDYDPDVIFTTRFNQNGRYSTNVVSPQISSSDFTLTPFDLPTAGLGGFLDANPETRMQLQDLTNTAGRVEITADSLDLTLASIRAENLITISANNITGHAGMQLDAPNINLELLSTDTLIISNFYPSTVRRLNGEISVWSGVWQVAQSVTNMEPATYDPFLNGFRSWFGSHTINYTYHMTIVDHNISTNQFVTAQRLRLLSTNVVLVDPIVINDLFVIDGGFSGDTAFTFSPTNSTNVLEFTDNVGNITGGNFPNLDNFTNNGTILSPQQFNLGFDRDARYSNIVNNGTIQAGAALFRSHWFDNTDTLSATNGSLFIEAQTNRLRGGSLSAALSARLTGDDLSATNTTIDAESVYIDVKKRVTDEGATNDWTVSRGFTLISNPIKGDLLGTTLRSVASTNFNNVHIWNAEDFGDDSAGYTNNVALGKLVLDAEPGGRFFFNGVGAGSAMYVDTIELHNYATNFESAVSVASNIKLYFAHLVDSNNVSLAEKFADAHGDRVTWVSEETRSGPMVAISTGIGQTTNMTARALRALLPVGEDYDGDGISNDIDTTPFSGFTVNDVSAVFRSEPSGSDARPHAKITWQALPNTTYTIEYRDSVADIGWKPLTYVISASNGEMSAYDPLPENGQRFYRVRYSR